LPRGLSLSTRGVLSGTPTKAGIYLFSITVTDSSNPAQTATATYTVTIRLGISPSTLPAATVNAAYTKTLSVAGGTAPYMWALKTGQLPPGLSLSTGGVVSGTPTKAGTYTFTLAVADSSSPANTGSASYTVKVAK